MSLGALSEEERRLIAALRDIPPSLRRDSLTLLLQELTELVREPHCAEMQADGVPCASAHVACDECQQITVLLDGLRSRLREP
jgi:hypothetical protein